MNIAECGTAKGAGLLVSDWSSWYEIELQARGCRKATVDNRRRALLVFCRHSPNLEPAQVTSEILAQWRDHLAETLAPSSVNFHLAGMLAFLRWLESEDELGAVPTVTFARERRQTLTRADIYGPGDLTRMRAATASVRDTAILSLLEDTGIRASECAGLLVVNVDLAGRQALIHAEIAKSGHPRTVCFGHATAKALAKYMRQRSKHSYSWAPQLFLGRRGPATYHLIYRVVAAAGERAGVQGARPHRMRHMWAHSLKTEGVPTEVLMSLGGWHSTAMVARYGESAATERAIETYRRLGSPIDRETTRRLVG